MSLALRSGAEARLRLGRKAQPGGFERLVKGVAFLMKKNKIDVHMGTATFIEAKTLEVVGEDGTKNQLKAKDIVLATGASATSIPA